MVPIIDSTTASLVSMALDATTLRHQAIAQNIANVNTPGYRPLSVSFESRLAEARDQLERGNKAGLLDAVAGLTPTLDDTDAAPSVDGGSAVSLEMEIAKLSENTLHHQTMLKMLSRHYAIMSLAITEGKS